jgi:hypothetical protein
MKGKTAMRDDWRPTDQCLERLRAKYPRYDFEYYIEECRDFWLANGRMMKDWDATFRNWVRRAGQFGQPVIRRPMPEDYPVGPSEAIDILTIRAARSRGIDTRGKSEAQINHEIWEHDTNKMDEHRARAGSEVGRGKKARGREELLEDPAPVDPVRGNELGRVVRDEIRSVAGRLRRTGEEGEG